MQRTSDLKDLDTVREQELWFTLNDSQDFVHFFTIIMLISKEEKDCIKKRTIECYIFMTIKHI